MRSLQATMRPKRTMRNGDINLGICTFGLCIISYLPAVHATHFPVQQRSNDV